MQRRVLALLGSIGSIVAIACGSRATTPSPPPSGPLAGWVLDDDGPVANADVALLALTPERCPCAANVPNDYVEPNLIPACSCPASFQRWHERLAACEAPSTIAIVRSDARGRWQIDAPARGSLAATASGRARWLAVPDTARSITLALRDTKRPRFRIVAGDRPIHDARAALLFDDGRCVPLRRAGDVWAPPAPVPPESAVLVVEAPGYAPAIQAWDDDEDVAVPLFADRPVTGQCGPRARVATLVNPYQQLTTQVTRRRFRFEHVVGTHGKIRCTDERGVVEELDYLPENGEPSEAWDSVSSFDEGPCDPSDRVVVTELYGAPLANARVEHVRDPGVQLAEGATTTTDDHGVACVRELSDGGELTAVAPDARGGRCAGSASVRVPRTDPAKRGDPIRLRVPVRALERTTWRGRVVSAEGVPLPAASVRVERIAIPAQPGREACEAYPDGDFIETGLDGSFELRDVLRGTAQLEIQHPWYTRAEIEVALSGGPRDLALDRGARWTGRVLDPDGKPIERCDVIVEERPSGLHTAPCHANGAFTIKPLAPGTWTAWVQLEHHALGTYRTFAVSVTIARAEHHVGDIHWPAGEPISGIVVDAAGKPVPGARLTALPRGVEPLVGRFQLGEIMLEADATGRFAFLHLAPGTWTIRGDLRSGKRGQLDVAAGTTNVRFVAP